MVTKKKLHTPRRRRKTLPTRRAASTEDILAGHLGPKRVPSRWSSHFRHLVELRNDLLARKGLLVQDAMEEQPSFSQHMADAGTDSYDRDWALGMLSSEQNALYEIDQALTRIRSGTYGRCEVTGKPIESARLNSIPWTRFSAQAQRELEKRGAFSRTRLGQLKTYQETVSKQEVSGDESENEGEEAG